MDFDGELKELVLSQQSQALGGISARATLYAGGIRSIKFDAIKT